MTNHGAALVYVAGHPDATIREISAAIGVQERATARILRDLRAGGYLIATRIGRRNTYQLQEGQPLRHAVSRGHRVVDLLSGLVEAAQ